MRDKVLKGSSGSDPSNGSETVGSGEYAVGRVVPQSIAEVQEAFVRCHALERREPGGGRWPFAGDGPWHLLRREVEAGDYGGDGVDGAASSDAPRTPLSAAEVGELATLRSWLLLIPEATGKGMSVDHDRKLVWFATGRLHAGETSVPWKAVGRWIGSPRHPQTLSQRYDRALGAVSCRLNGWPERRAKVLAKADLVAEPLFRVGTFAGEFVTLRRPGR